MIRRVRVWWAAHCPRLLLSQDDYRYWRATGRRRLP